MDKTHAIVPLALVAAVFGALARRPVVAGASHDLRTDAKSATGAPASAAPASHGEDADLDTIDLLGDSLGVDVTTDGLRRRAARALDTLGSPRADGRTGDKALALLTDLLALPLRADAPGLPAARSAVARLAACRTARVEPDTRDRRRATCAADLEIVRGFITAYLNQDALRVAEPGHAETLLAGDFALVDKTPLKLAVLDREADDHHTQVDFLIAMLPDPVDSYTGWQFDPMLDAIAQAVSASDYVLDRFHLPDSDRHDTAAGSESAPAHRLHEIEPGVVIFRRHMDGGAGSGPSEARLVVLLAHENPSSGVHARALAYAIRLVMRWGNLRRTPASERTTIRLLGPTFSGSSDSIARALVLVERGVRAGYRLRFVSGSATDPLNQATIERAIPGYVGFRATVQPDAVLVPTLLQHLVRVGWSFPIGVLFEGNTQYGREMWKTMARSPVPGRQPSDPPLLIQMPFPMNFSRLRTTMATETSSAPTGALGLPSRFRPIAMEETGNPVDKIPHLHPSTAAAYAELGVSQMLQTLGRERVRTAALLATDPRDKLFLAQQLARHAPGVSIVTVESESLYIHPDYAPYLHGALVVSTYPLSNASQYRSTGAAGSERRRFANGSAQGIYNAALALLNYSEEGAPLAGEKTPRLLEYGLPGDRCDRGCRPPVWVSVIGRADAWPIRAYVPDATPTPLWDHTGGDPYVFTARTVGAATAAPTGALSPAAPPPPFTLLLMLLAALAGAVWAHTAGRWSAAPDAAGRDGARLVPVAAYQLTGVLSVLLIALVVGACCVLWLSIEPSAFSVAELAIAALSTAALIDAARRAVGGVVRRPRESTDRLKGRVAILSALALAAATVGWGLWALADHVAAGFADRANAASFVTRALSLDSGVSPLLPVTLLCLVVTLWAGLEIRGRSAPRPALADPAIQPLLQQALHGKAADLQSPWARAARGMLDVPAPFRIATAVAVAATCLFAFDPFVAPLVSIEGVSFGRFVSTAMLVIQGLILLALLQFVYLWTHLERLLKRVAWHEGVAAYDRISRDLYPSSLVSRVPRFMELQLLVTQWQRCIREAGWESTRRAGAPARGRALAAMFEKEMRQAPDRAWSQSTTWKLVAGVAAQATRTLRAAGVERAAPQWGESAAVAAASPLASSARGGAVAVALQADPILTIVGRQPALQAALQAHEDLVAMAVALLVRDAHARLEQNLVFVTLGVLLVFCSHTLFPFEAHQRLELLGWIHVALTLAATLGVIVRLKRNEIVGRLASPIPGKRATWDMEFVLKLVVFGVLPLLTLFAARFPDIGWTILRWIEPVQKALP